MNATQVPTDVEKVTSLFREALDVIRPDLHAARVVTVPDVTATGLDAVTAVMRSQPSLASEVAHLLGRAASIPSSSRRRRVLTGLAKFLTGVPKAFQYDLERWFRMGLVRDVARASGATEAEASGFIAMLMLTPFSVLIAKGGFLATESEQSR